MPYRNPEQRRQYAREWAARRRREFFEGQSCSRCGSLEDLEIHHEDPSKKESHKIWSWSEQRRNKELEKCAVLCHDCHKKISDESMRTEWEHGIPYGYRTRGCRCDECRAAHREYMREYKASRKVS